MLSGMPEKTHIRLARERSVPLHDKISRDIDRCLVTDMNVRFQRAGHGLQYFSDIGTALPWVYNFEISASIVLKDRRSEQYPGMPRRTYRCHEVIE